MDNLTHALSGLLLGDALLSASQRLGSKPSAALRRSVLLTGAIAANAPDLDLLYIGITQGKLGYLLHHRGHTHTVVVAITLGLLITAMVMAWGQRGPLRQPTSLVCQWLPWCTGVSAALLHLLLDLGNNYGIHPAWPWDNRWFYGDTFFIVEPWWLLLLLGVVRPQFSGRIGRGIVLAMAGLVVGLAWWATELISPALATSITIVGGSWMYFLRHANASKRLMAAGLGISLLVASFSVGKATATTSLRAAVASTEENSTLPSTGRFTMLDVVATPSPANPLCWSMLSIERSTDRYRVRLARVSAWPLLQDVSRCPDVASEQTAPIEPLRHPASAPAKGLEWRGQFSAPIQELQHTVSNNCRARAFLRFARVPFWIADSKSDQTQLLGDLRYDRQLGPDFSEILLDELPNCPNWEPPWLAPRLDLLRTINSMGK